MLIDFHTHTFPKAIAEKTLSMLLYNMTHTYNIDQRLNYSGTPDALEDSMIQTGVDISVTMPIATKPQQFDTINEFAKSTRSEKIIPFGAIHPMSEDIDSKLSYLYEEGFSGIKLHPDYQGVYADDSEFISLVRKATDKGMYVMIHSGQDTGIKPPFRAEVGRIKTLLNKVDEEFVILAHMGGFAEWDAVLKDLAKTRAYFDTSVVSRFIPMPQYREIIAEHGADRILFGSDQPWESPQDTLKFLKKANLTPDEEALITYKNAAKILGIPIPKKI